MLDKYKVIESLENKKSEFLSFKTDYSEDLLSLKLKLEALFEVSAKDIIINLESKTEAPGALPTNEWDLNKLIISFDKLWDNHEQARTWAYNILLDKITVAIDGSQILPSKDFSPPVAAVQVAKFENYHTTDGKYIKDISFSVISPQELLSKEESLSTDENYVSFKRFELEINTIIEYMEQSYSQSLKPLVFFDGSLILSFITAEGATGRDSKLRDNYINTILLLLETSEQTKTPIIGFVDTSNARDIVDMLKNYYNITDNINVIDTRIVNDSMKWGDRSTVFCCKRPGVLTQYKNYKDKICFAYLKTNQNLPARLEFPLWLYEDKAFFEEILDVVRAEIIVGNGYIYSIESADAVAAISSLDKKLFYQLFSDFAIKYNLGLNLSQKTLSKSKRR